MGIHANNRDARLSRIYCEGAWHREINGGLSQGDNPWNATTEAQQNAAWDQGWVDNNAGTVDLSCCALPRTGLPAPEILNAPRY